MIGLGSIVNAAAIVAGGCVGLVAGKAISERVRVTLVSGMAVGTLFVGASSTFSKMLSVGDGGAVECRGALMLVMSLAIGAVAGEIIDIDGKLQRERRIVPQRVRYGITDILHRGDGDTRCAGGRS